MAEQAFGPFGQWHYEPVGDVDGDPALDGRAGVDHFVLDASGEELTIAPSEEIGLLWAAAPDLLEAAAYLLDHGDSDPDTGYSAETYNEAWEMLEKAVAKAEGENG